MPKKKKLNSKNPKYMDKSLLKKKPLELSAILWKTYYQYEINEYLPLPLNGRVSFTSEIKMPDN